MAASGYAPWSRIAGVGLYGASETIHDYMDIGEPNVLDVPFGHPMASEKIARGVRAVHLEA